MKPLGVLTASESSLNQVVGLITVDLGPLELIDCFNGAGGDQGQSSLLLNLQVEV